ncbi:MULTISPECIES: PAS domain-containing methyl-accepting chemotaxis protein [unclassified Ectothiorhodospira]|uniref:methyl-accepting chemotaxis protein n=1 Tax=unclassified Ectothiorhodospira TaxID=2684909 RepID=UPI001EE84563|nr:MULTISPECIES: PAS domain-containing methyl-accepting chemotaxis protein [unclassified Ectothiorhodospira]MCG5514587.1 methyl-accepting chemotaxis protein [Ectothiorhodospira sp. 9100]MCG5518039.1 methyl-accepting chemotaxis protein [Ectothiorhodospira sp. 9905]
MKKNLPVTGREQAVSDHANILSTTDLKGAISYVNDDFIRISGFVEEELLKRNHNIVRHPDMPPAAFKDLWDSVKSGRAWMGLVKNRCKNGDHYWVSAYVMPIRKDGQVAEYQSVRTRPPREWVDRATSMYAGLMNDRLPLVMRLPMPPVAVRLVGGMVMAAALSLALGGLWGTPIISSLVPVLLALILGSGLSAWLVRPLGQLRTQARGITRNPVGQYVYTGRADEFGEIEFAMRMLRSETGAAVGRVSDAASQLAEHADSMVGSVRRTRDEILRQQAETDQVATAVNEMTASVQEVARNAQNAAEAATTADTSAGQGRQVVASTEQVIGQLADEVERAAQVISQLEESAGSIGAVLEVIRGIAEQTNMLALNAAIEAARAGEHGRGFSVVADEVRSLASRTHESTQEIQTTIEKLQRGAHSSVEVMQNSRQQAVKSVEQAGKAARSLEEIARSVAAITDMSAQIATAVDQQGSVSEEINQSITRIRGYADANAQSGQQIESAASQVAELSAELKLLARQFWERRN